jgi:hypothetical protein
MLEFVLGAESERANVKCGVNGLLKKKDRITRFSKINIWSRLVLNAKTAKSAKVNGKGRTGQQIQDWLWPHLRRLDPGRGESP